MLCCACNERTARWALRVYLYPFVPHSGALRNRHIGAACWWDRSVTRLWQSQAFRLHQGCGGCRCMQEVPSCDLSRMLLLVWAHTILVCVRCAMLAPGVMCTVQW